MPIITPPRVFLMSRAVERTISNVGPLDFDRLSVALGRPHPVLLRAAVDSMLVTKRLIEVEVMDSWTGDIDWRYDLPVG